MKKGIAILSFCFLLSTGIFSQEVYEINGQQYWNSLSREGKKAFLSGLILGNVLEAYEAKLETGKSIELRGPESVLDDAFIDSMDKIIADTNTEPLPLFVFVAPFYKMIYENLRDPEDNLITSEKLFNHIEKMFGAHDEQNPFTVRRLILDKLMGKTNIAPDVEKVTWLTVRMNPDKYAKAVTPSAILLNSIILFPEHQQGPSIMSGYAPTIQFKARIEYDNISLKRSDDEWSFAICMKEQLGKKWLAYLDTKPPEEKSNGVIIQDVQCQIYKDESSKTWIVIINDFVEQFFTVMDMFGQLDDNHSNETQ